MGKRQPWDEACNAVLLEWLEGLLSERQLSRADLVWMLGTYRRTSPSAVDSWFSGATVPSYPVLVALVATFGELPPFLRGAPLPEGGRRPPATGQPVEGVEARSAGTKATA